MTNLSRPAERVVAFYNRRGRAEQHINEGKNAINWIRPEHRRRAVVGGDRGESRLEKERPGRAFLRSVKTFPIIGYQSDIVYLNPTAGVPFSVLSHFDKLIDEFQKERGR